MSLKEIPFLRIGLPYCAGIAAGLFITAEPWFMAAFSLFTSVILLSVLVKRSYGSGVIFGLVNSVCLFAAGNILYTLEKNNISLLEQESQVIECELSDYPEEKPASMRLVGRLKNTETNKGKYEVKGFIIFYLSPEPRLNNLQPGDILKISCKPAPIERRGNPCEFDYKFYALCHSTRYSAFAGKNGLVSVSQPEHRKLSSRALIIRERIIEMYRDRGIEGDNLALVSAMILGQKKMLDSEQKESFIKAGVMHVMAVSGLHAVILSMFVMNMLFFLRGRLKVLRILIAITVLWIFAFVTGLTPSVIRAALMFTFLQAGNMMKRRVNGINSVLASAFVMAVRQPSVIFDAGFQLSYAAVIFIIAFYRSLYLKVNVKNFIVRQLWQSSALTLIAQAGTLSLTVAMFNRFPLWFLLTNLVIVPLSSLLIITGCIFLLTYPLPFLSKLFAVILSWQAEITASLTRIASSLPLASVENIGMPPGESLLMFLLILFIFLFILGKQPSKLHLSLIAAVILSFLITVREIKTRTSSELIVYNTYSGFNAAIRSGTTLYLWSDSEIITPEAARHASTMGLDIKFNHLNDKPVMLEFKGHKIIITGTRTNTSHLSVNPDFLILRESTGIAGANISAAGRIVVAGKKTLNSQLTGRVSVPLNKVFFTSVSGAFMTTL